MCVIHWEIVSHFQSWHWLCNNAQYALTRKPKSFLLISDIPKDIFLFVLQKGITHTWKKIHYILALIHYLLKIHLRHLIFDWDRLMGILVLHLVFSVSITALTWLESVWLYIIIPVLYRRTLWNLTWYYIFCLSGRSA